MGVKYDITMHGPLFDGTAGGIVDQMLAAVTEHVTESGRDMVGSFSAEFKSHPTWRWEMDLTAAQPDRYHGLIYDTVPYTAWLEGVTSRNIVTRFKGYHMWKISAAWLKANANALAQTVVAHYMPLLGGRGLHDPAGGTDMPPMRAAQRTGSARPGWVPWENSKFDPDGRRR